MDLNYFDNPLELGAADHLHSSVVDEVEHGVTWIVGQNKLQDCTVCAQLIMPHK